MSVSVYRHEYEPVDPVLITGSRDAVQGVMPPLGGGLWCCARLSPPYDGGNQGFVCCQVKIKTNERDAYKKREMEIILDFVVLKNLGICGHWCTKNYHFHQLC